MKKKVVSLLLALTMAASCTLVAFAEEGDILLSTSDADVVEESTPEGAQSDALPVELQPAFDYTTHYDAELAAEVDALLAQLEAEASEESLAVASEENESTFDENLSIYGTGVEGFVTRMYRLILNRQPDSAGFSDWTSGLRSGKYKGSDIIYGFFASNEYKARNRSAEQSVTDAYNAVLGRQPDADGKQYWIKAYNSGVSVLGIAAGFCGSTEFQRLCSEYGISAGSMPYERMEWRDRNANITQFVSRFYTKCLGRNYDIDGLNNWCAGLISGGLNGASLANGFIFSQEYKNKHTTNIEYVTMLYATFFDRDPDSSGLYSWVEQLNYSRSREAVLNGFLGSAEYSTLCNAAGLQVGGSLPTIDNTDAWKANVRFLALVNGQRVSEGKRMLKLRQDMFEVAQLRAKEQPLRAAENYKNGNRDSSGKYGKLDLWRPNNKGTYLTAYTELGISCSNMYEARANAPTSADADTLVSALMADKDAREQLLKDDATTIGTAFVTSDNRAWYAVELSNLAV